jgi:hypothetical protein
MIDRQLGSNYPVEKYVPTNSAHTLQSAGFQRANEQLKGADRVPELARLDPGLLVRRS